MKITDFTALKNADYNVVRAEIKAALAPLAEKYGVSFDAAGISVAPGFATFKLNLALTTEGVKESRETLVFRQLAHLFGFEKTDLFKTFALGAKRYQIVGLKAGRSKGSIVAASEGKSYLVPPEIVLKALGKLTQAERREGDMPVHN